MKVCIVTREDGLHLNDPLKHVIARSRRRLSALVLIEEAPRVFKSPSYRVRAFLVTLLAMRPRYFLKTVIKSVRCAVAGRAATLEEFARARAIPVFRAKTPNDPSCLRLLAGISPDVVIHQSPFILKRPFLAIPRVCTLNRHGSLLPLYRGLLAPFWALSESASTSGVTIHTVDESIDGGKAVVQEAILLGRKECLGSLLEKGFGMSGALFCRALDRIEGDEDSFRFLADGGESSGPRAPGKTYGFPAGRDILAYRWRRMKDALAGR